MQIHEYSTHKSPPQALISSSDTFTKMPAHARPVYPPSFKFCSLLIATPHLRAIHAAFSPKSVTLKKWVADSTRTYGLPVEDPWYTERFLCGTYFYFYFAIALHRIFQPIRDEGDKQWTQKK